MWNSNPTHFAAAIDSLLCQSFTDFELILSDNGSDDGARQMYVDAARRDSRIRLFRHEVNTGAIANFRFVLEQARGELFMWAADDDSRSPELLSRLVAALDSNPQCVAAGSEVAIIDENGRQTGTAGVDRRHVGSRSPVRRMFAMLAPYENMDVYGLHRRSVLKDLDLTMQSIWLDRHMIADILLHGPIARIDERLFYYRMADRGETYRRRAYQHFGESARPTGEVASQDPEWAKYDFAGTAFRLLATVLVSRAPLTTAQRASCFVALLGVLVSEGWFTREELYATVPALRQAMHERKIGATLRLAMKLLTVAPTFPVVAGRRRIAEVFQRETK